MSCRTNSQLNASPFNLMPLPTYASQTDPHNKWEGRSQCLSPFGNSAPLSLLLKLVDLSSRSETPAQTPADRAINYGRTTSILADFHVLKGLKVNITLGDDLLATVNAFIGHSTDFDQRRTWNSLYPGLTTIITVKGLGKSILNIFGKRIENRWRRRRP